MWLSKLYVTVADTAVMKLQYQIIFRIHCGYAFLCDYFYDTSCTRYETFKFEFVTRIFWPYFRIRMRKNNFDVTF